LKRGAISRDNGGLGKGGAVRVDFAAGESEGEEEELSQINRRLNLGSSPRKLLAWLVWVGVEKICLGPLVASSKCLKILRHIVQRVLAVSFGGRRRNSNATGFVTGATGFSTFGAKTVNSPFLAYIPCAPSIVPVKANGIARLPFQTGQSLRGGWPPVAEDEESVALVRCQWWKRVKYPMSSR